jgi:hypothetical protein
MAKSPASVPLSVRLAMRNGVLPRLVSTTALEALLLPTACTPKPRDVVERLTAVPIPRRLTICGLLGSLSTMTRLAD